MGKTKRSISDAEWEVIQGWKKEHPKSKFNPEILGPGLLGVVALVSLNLLLALSAVVLWQCFEYLRTGFWPQLSTADLFVKMMGVDSWFGQPTSWFGLHEMFSKLHGGLFLSIVGSCSLIAMIIVSRK